jgi:hypothetical protein
MISPEKLAANQANAQFSTGPRTPQGKTASAQNSRTHGLCSKDRLVANEDKAEYQTMEVKLLLDIRPKGELELILFSELLTASWQLRRICRMETELSAGHDSYTALLDDEGLQKKLDRLGRHHTRFERTFHRSLKELKALQTSRAQKEAAHESSISKRSQPAAEPDLTFAELADRYDKMAQEIVDKAA